MTEYVRSVVRLYRKGMTAWEIARELGRTAPAIHSVIHQARKKGELPYIPAESRRSMGQWKMYERFR